MDIVSKIRSYIKEIKENDMDLSEINRIVSGIKRACVMYRKDIYLAGDVPDILVTNKLTKLLLSEYDLLKNFEGINETLEYLAQDYDNMEEYGNEIETKDKSFNIRTNILGNPGTDSRKMDTEYVKNIINNKIETYRQIDSSDIINILRQQAEKMYTYPLEYQTLINDFVMTYIDDSIYELENPQILDVLSDYAKSHKNQGEYTKSKEIYEKALTLEQFSKDIEYEELLKEYNQLSEYVSTIEENFTLEKISDLPELRKFVENHFIPNQINIDEDIFVKENRGPRKIDSEIKRNNNSSSSYKMPTELKLEAFERILPKLGFEIKEILVGKDQYESYAILPVADTNISILENFNDNINEALYIIKNENIEEVIKLTKRQAKEHEGVRSVNHVENFDSYINNLNKAIKSMVYEKEEQDNEIIKDSNFGSQSKKKEYDLDFINTSNNEFGTKNMDALENIETTEMLENNDIEVKKEITVSEKISDNETVNKNSINSMEELSIEELEVLEGNLDEEMEEMEFQNTQLTKKLELLERIKGKMSRKDQLEKEIIEKKKKLKNIV